MYLIIDALFPNKHGMSILDLGVAPDTMTIFHTVYLTQSIQSFKDTRTRLALQWPFSQSLVIDIERPGVAWVPVSL